MLGSDSAEIAFSVIGHALTYSTFIFLYPLIGNTPGIKNPKRFLVLAFCIKFEITVIMDLCGFFPGYNNFIEDYEYGKTYFTVVILNMPGVGSTFYYPPACSLFWAFLYLVNPWRSTLVFRMEMMIFDLAIAWMILKISQLKELNLPSNAITSALILYTFSAIQLYVLLFYQKPDYFEVFLTLIGVYYTIKKRWMISAFVLMFCGFYKIYTFLWIAGMILFFIKKKDWKSFRSFILSTLVSGFCYVAIFYLIEGFFFFENLLRFGWHFTIWEAAFNLNWSYYLKYLNVPFINFLPPILILVVLFFYVFKKVQTIDLTFFINSTVITLIFYPSINLNYMIWLVPFIGLNFVSHADQYRKGLLSLDIVHGNMDMHIFAWVILLGYASDIDVKSFSGEPVILVILLLRAMMIVPLLVGLYFFLGLPRNKKKI